MSRPDPADARERPLVLFLRCLAVLDLCAVTVTLLPDAAIDQLHRGAGLGPFPAHSTAHYLARITGSLYAVHGGLLWWLSTDVRRYALLLRGLARLMVAHGMVLLAIDLTHARPWWWTAGEGPLLALLGVCLGWPFSRIISSVSSACYEDHETSDCSSSSNHLTKDRSRDQGKKYSP
ncbi:MAG: hypothetical protein ACKO3P_21080 [Planctomycetaceae bacterium]